VRERLENLTGHRLANVADIPPALNRGWGRLRNDLRKRWQRQQRGWGEYDAWSFDHYLAQTIADGCKWLRENSHGYPMGIGRVKTMALTDEQEDSDGARAWEQILLEIEEGFRILADWDTFDQPDRGQQEKIDRAWDLFRYWFQALWD
jgi:hypothetical protein